MFGLFIDQDDLKWAYIEYRFGVVYNLFGDTTDNKQHNHKHVELFFALEVLRYEALMYWRGKRSQPSKCKNYNSI